MNRIVLTIAGSASQVDGNLPHIAQEAYLVSTARLLLADLGHGASHK
jgi:hypothetical protein